jgi:hypothetical protein
LPSLSRTAKLLALAANIELHMHDVTDTNTLSSTLVTLKNVCFLALGEWIPKSCCVSKLPKGVFCAYLDRHPPFRRFPRPSWPRPTLAVRSLPRRVGSAPRQLGSHFPETFR